LPGRSPRSSSMLPRGLSPTGTSDARECHRATDRPGWQIGAMPRPWSSQLAGDLRRERKRLSLAFIELRATLRRTEAASFADGADEQTRLVNETETDYVSLVAAAAESLQLETLLEAADREATQREVDAATLVLEQLRELVVALSRRLP
jgi:hypothetical protein